MVSQGAGRINGAFGEADWTPVRYVNRSTAAPRSPGSIAPRASGW